jgi:uncharacterized membrane protein YhfC
MNILTALYIFKILLLVGIPVVLGIYLVRRFDLEGKLWWIPAAVFLVSQIILQILQYRVVVPYVYSLGNSGSLSSLSLLIVGGFIVGTSSGLIEEVFRYVMNRWWTKDARTFESGLLLGVGFGGAASIFLGFQVLAYYTDKAYYSFPVVISQILMIVIYICLSVMILRSITQKQWQWFLFAIGFHVVMESFRLIALNLANDIVAALVVGIFTILSVLILKVLYQQNSSPKMSQAGLGGTKIEN